MIRKLSTASIVCTLGSLIRRPSAAQSGTFPRELLPKSTSVRCSISAGTSEKSWSPAGRSK